MKSIPWLESLGQIALLLRKALSRGTPNLIRELPALLEAGLLGCSRRFRRSPARRGFSRSCLRRLPRGADHKDRAELHRGPTAARDARQCQTKSRLWCAHSIRGLDGAGQPPEGSEVVVWRQRLCRRPLAFYGSAQKSSRRTLRGQRGGAQMSRRETSTRDQAYRI